MKFTVALLIALATLAPKASFAWAPHVQFAVTPHYAQVQVSNPTPYGAFCQGYTYGVAQTGHYVQAWFSAFLPPFGYQYAYVYSNGPFSFVNAWANINCHH